MTTPQPRESAIQAQIVARLALMPGVLVWRNNSGVAHHKDRPVFYGLGKGSADIVGLVRIGAISRFVALEVKRPGERPTTKQVAWLTSVNALGGYACVVTSVREAEFAVAAARAGQPAPPPPAAKPDAKPRRRTKASKLLEQLAATAKGPAREVLRERLSHRN